MPLQSVAMPLQGRCNPLQCLCNPLQGRYKASRGRFNPLQCLCNAFAILCNAFARFPKAFAVHCKAFAVLFASLGETLQCFGWLKGSCNRAVATGLQDHCSAIGLLQRDCRTIILQWDACSTCRIA
jgi:hypothetical protein